MERQLKNFNEFLLEKEFREIYGVEEFLEEDIAKEYDDLKKFFGILTDNFGKLTAKDVSTVVYAFVKETKTMVLFYVEKMKSFKEKDLEKQDADFSFVEKFLQRFNAKQLEPVDLARKMSSKIPFKTIELAFGK